MLVYIILKGHVIPFESTHKGDEILDKDLQSKSKFVYKFD